MPPTIELVREVDAYRQSMCIDVFEWRGSADAPAGWKVRVVAYDGKSSQPSIFELIPGGKNARATVPLLASTAKRYEEEGWTKRLSAEAQGRIDVREAREAEAERAREADLTARAKAFPATKLDARLDSAIAKPAGVRELDLRAAASDRLTFIPKTVRKLAALEVLRLDGNGLLELPDAVSGCKELRELHLANNALERFPVAVTKLKKLTVLDLRKNHLRRFWASPKVPMRLELAGNPLEPAEQDLLTRSAIGDFRKLSHVSIDTDCLFPIDLSYFEVDYIGVKALPTESIVLYGRAPTDEERSTLSKLLPKATIEHCEA